MLGSSIANQAINMNHGYLPDLVAMEFIKFVLKSDTQKTGYIASAVAAWVQGEKKRLEGERVERREKNRKRRQEKKAFGQGSSSSDIYDDETSDDEAPDRRSEDSGPGSIASSA